MSDGTERAYATVCARAVRLLELLRPCETCGPQIKTACVELTLALAAVPEAPVDLTLSLETVEVPAGEGAAYPMRRVSLGLSEGGEMHVSVPGKADEPVDERTLEALRSIGEAALAKMRAEAASDG